MIIKWQAMPAFYVLTNCDVVEQLLRTDQKVQGSDTTDDASSNSVGCKKLKF